MPQFTNEEQPKDLALFVDITAYLNTANISLQGHSQGVPHLSDSVLPFVVNICFLTSFFFIRSNLDRFHVLKLVSRNENYGLNFIPKIMEFKTEFQGSLFDFML